MAMSEQPKSKSAKALAKHNEATRIDRQKDETEGQAFTRAFTGPFVTSGHALQRIQEPLGNSEASHSDYVSAMVRASDKVNAGNMKDVEAFLVSQNMVLNGWFGELSRRAINNLKTPEYFEAAQVLFKMAMKAQNQARMTLETLSNIKNPPAVYAKQANISNGPQQVNNTLVAHAGENKNQPRKLLEATHEAPMDTGTKDIACPKDSPMEAMAEINRPENQ
jgi:hypothetical protein